MRSALIVTFAAIGAAIGLAAAATATPPALVASTPADAFVGQRPDAIRLSFDQAVLADGTHFKLQMMSMPGMQMNQPAPVAIGAVNHDGGNKLDLGLGQPLAPGRYELAWSVANTAGETSSGVLHFGVR